MNRRGLLAFLGGAVASGPKLASGIAATTTTQAPSFGLGYGSIAPSNSAEKEWRVSRIADLKRLLSGWKSPDEIRTQRINRLHMLEQVERCRLDGLRSVSAPHKYRMFIDSEARRRDRMGRLCRENELSQLLGLKD